MKVTGGGGTNTSITVERGPVYHALVQDAEGKIAKDNGTNVYVFDGTPAYPVKVSYSPLAFIDADGNGKPSKGDLRFKKELSSCGTNVTPISTLVSAKASKCGEDEVAKVEKDLVEKLGVKKEELSKLPSKQNKEAIIASNATFVELVKNKKIKDIKVSSIKTAKKAIKEYVKDKADAKAIEKAVIKENKDKLKSISSEQAKVLEKIIKNNPITDEKPKFTKDNAEYAAVWWGDDDTYRYSHYYINSSSHFIEEEKEYDRTKTDKKWEDHTDDDGGSYYLEKDGEWKQHGSDSSDMGKANIDENGMLRVGDVMVKLIRDINIEGKEFEDSYGNDLELNGTFPKGSRAFLTDNFSTTNTKGDDEPVVKYVLSEIAYGSTSSTLKKYIEKHCGTSTLPLEAGNKIGLSFAGTKKSDGSYTCNGDATSGTLFETSSEGGETKVTDDNAGTWEIKTEKKGVKILILYAKDWARYREDADGNTIFTVRDGAVWEGETHGGKKGKGIPVRYKYNKTAFEAIKAAIEKKYK